MATPRDFAYGYDVPAWATTPADRYEPLASTVATFATIESEHQDRHHPEIAPIVKSIYAAGLTFATEFDKDLGKASDSQYSREGTAKLRAAAAAKALKSLEPLEQEARKLREHVETFDATLHKGGVIQRPSDVTETEWERRLAEVRASIAHLDPVKRDLMYSDALKTDDAVLIAAFESASPVLFEKTDESSGQVVARSFVPYIAPDKVLENQLERARARYPEEVALRDRSERIGAAYSSVVALIKREVEARMGGASWR